MTARSVTGTGSPGGPFVLAAALASCVLAGAFAGVARAQEGDDVRAEADTAALADSLRRLGDTLRVAESDRTPPPDTLSLEQALRTALDQSPQLEGQRARTSAAQASRWADWGAFLPTASVSANFTRIDFTRTTFESEEGVASASDSVISSVSKSANQSLRIGLDLLEGGRRLTELEAGGAELEAARLRLSESERRVVAEVKQAYFEARKQDRLVEIARRQLENRRRELAQTRRRYRIAAVGRADLLGARLEVRRAEVTLLDTRDVAAAARRDLRVTMGRPEGAARDGIGLADVAAPPDPTDLSARELVGRSVETHPEIRRLEAEIEGASARLWGARSGYLPNLSLSFTLGRNESVGRAGSFLNLDPEDTSQSFSLTASWSIFDGFSRREQNAQARADLQGVRADRTRRRLEIEKTVRDLVDEIRRRDRRLDLLESQLDMAEERLELLGEQYRLGSASFDQLQQAIDDVTRAERDLVRERHDHLDAWARLERWAGDVAPGLPSPAVEGGAGRRRDDARSAGGGPWPGGPDRR